MKVLWVDHPEADYLAGQLYIGLCQELGEDNVIDYPFKESYHGKVHTYPSIYETDPGPGAYHTWVVEAGVPMGRTPPFEWMPAWGGHPWSHEEVTGALSKGDFGLVILASPRRNNTAALTDLVDAVGGLERMPLIVIVDGEDSETIHWNLIDRFNPRAYFKRELVEVPDADPYPAERERVAACGGARILPCPLAPVVSGSDFGREAIDVGLFGGSNTPGGIAPWWEAVRTSNAKSYLFGKLPFHEYLTAVSQCRIAVAPRGHSKDSLRSWEMLALGGPLVMVQRHNLIRCHPFIEGEHCVHFDGPDDLREKINHYLSDETARVRIAEAGHVHAREHHTPRARARYILHEAGVA